MEEILNPNCSESVLRIRTDKMNAFDKEKLYEELKKKFDSSENEDAGETFVDEDTIFGIPHIVINGDEPFNNREEIDKVLKEHKVNDEWIHEDER